MYLRYRAKYFNEEKDKMEFGFFSAAEYVAKYVVIEVEDRTKLEKLIYWFDHNLPIPEYYQKKRNRQEAKSATSWFKDTATEFIQPMNEIAHIIEKYNVEVERIHAKKILGKKIYEDDFQITIIPYRESRNNVK